MPRLKAITLEIREEKILDFLQENNGATAKELSQLVGVSTQQIYVIMKSLIQRGLALEGTGKYPPSEKPKYPLIKTYYLEP